MNVGIWHWKEILNIKIQFISGKEFNYMYYGEIKSRARKIHWKILGYIAQKKANRKWFVDKTNTKRDKRSQKYKNNTKMLGPRKWLEKLSYKLPKEQATNKNKPRSIIIQEDRLQENSQAQNKLKVQEF